MDVQFGTPIPIRILKRFRDRFILNDYSWHTSVSQLLLDLNLPSFQSRRSNSKAIMLYKIIQPNSSFLTPPLPVITIIPARYRTQELMPICIPSCLQPSESGTVQVASTTVDCCSLESFKQSLI